MTTTARLEPGGAANGANSDKEVEAAFEQLGVPVREGKVAVDYFRLCFGYCIAKTERGIIFVPLAGDPRSSELVRKYRHRGAE